jgi:hypothetical protein
MQQGGEGWHLATEREHPAPGDVADEGQGDDEHEADDPDSGIDGCGRPGAARTHRTCPRCRQTTGPSRRPFTAPDGKPYRPSMFLTLTPRRLRPGDRRCVPVDPDRYDDRRAGARRYRPRDHAGRRTVVTTLFVDRDEALEDIARFVGRARPSTTAGDIERLGRRPQAVAERAAAVLEAHRDEG